MSSGYSERSCSGNRPGVTPDPAVQSLILANPTPITQYYGAEASDPLTAKLTALAAHPSVAGVLVRLDEEPGLATAYAAWQPESVESANHPSAAIQAAVLGRLPQYPNLNYIVLVGHDAIIPLRRVEDNAGFGREKEYTGRSHANQTSALYHALARQPVLNHWS